MIQWMIFGLIWESTAGVLNLKAVSQFKKDFKKYRHNQVILDAFKDVLNLIRKAFRSSSFWQL